MLYQRVTGDFYTINSEGKFTLPFLLQQISKNGILIYNHAKGCDKICEISQICK